MTTPGPPEGRGSSGAADGERLVGIFDADGTFAGELRYVFGKLAGVTHCALCDITHGWNPRGRPSWKRACAAAGLEVELIHRNEATAAQLSVAGTLPAVLAGVDENWRLVVTATDLADFAGDPDALAGHLSQI